ncbi:MAG: ATP-binding protein [Ignavibacteriales bacterium]
MHSLIAHALLDPALSTSGRVLFTISDAIFRAMPAGVALLDGGGRATALNKEWDRIVGPGFEGQILSHPKLNYAELGGNLGLWAAEDAARMSNAIRDIISGDAVEFCEEIQVQNGGGAGWHRVSLVPLDPSTFDGILAMHVDVTAERMLRDEMQRFIYIASHDLQEPLRTIASFMQLLERRYKGQLDSEADDFIHYAVDGAKRLSALIPNLLTYSRLTGESHPKKIEVRDCLDEVLHSLETTITEAGASFDVGELPAVNIDPVQLASLFQNLISNAVKYRDHSRPLRISLAAKREGEFWQFSVSDNGIGIASEYHGVIFGMFERLDPQDGRGGTGIGLAIVQRIVERAGGRLWVESREGEGAAFHFTLPA